MTASNAGRGPAPTGAGFPRTRLQRVAAMAVPSSAHTRPPEWHAAIPELTRSGSYRCAICLDPVVKVDGAGDAPAWYMHGTPA